MAVRVPGRVCFVVLCDGIGHVPAHATPGVVHVKDEVESREGRGWKVEVRGNGVAEQQRERGEVIVARRSLEQRLQRPVVVVVVVGAGGSDGGSDGGAPGREGKAAPLDRRAGIVT